MPQKTIKDFFKATRLYQPLIPLLIMIVIGVSGYILLEKYRFVDALYMTLITMSTVGFMEVQPLTDTGKIFTSFLIVSTLGVFFYSLTFIGQSFVAGEARSFLFRLFVLRKIKRMKSHVIVCGLGRTGRVTCRELLAQGEKVVVVDRKHRDQLLVPEDVIVVEGESTDEKILLDAGIMQAKAIVCCMPSDADNVFVVLTARGLNPKLHIVSRASAENSHKKLTNAGANTVIRPEEIGGVMMASIISKPDVSELWRMLSFTSVAPENFYEVQDVEFHESAFGKTLDELNIRHMTSATVVGMKTADGRIVLNPTLHMKLEKGGKLFLLANQEQVTAFKDYVRNLR
jgi:voltage-gated potassium channel